MGEVAGPGRHRGEPTRHVGGADLSAFLDDELDDDAALELTHHVHACGMCRSELEALRETRSALRRLPALQAPVLTAEVRSLRRVRTWTRRVVAAGGLAAAAMALGAAAYVAGDAPARVVPPVEELVREQLARTDAGDVEEPLEGR